MAQTKVKLISDGVIVQGNLHASHGITTAHIGEGSNLYYTDARVGSYLSTNSFATESYVGTQIANLVDSSPSALNTLNELAAALGDDANFSTTVTNSIALKAPIASPTFTGFARAPYIRATASGDIALGGVSGISRIQSNASNDIRFLNSSNQDLLTLVASTREATFARGATFAGEVTISTETQYLNFKKASTADILSTIVSETDAGTGGKLRFLTKRNGDTQVNALILDDNQNATFAGTVLIDGVSNYTGLVVKGSGASRPAITWSNVNQADLGIIYGTENNALVIATGASGLAALTLDSSQNSTFAGNVTIDNGTSSTLIIEKDATGGGKIQFNDAGSQQAYISLDAYEHIVYYGAANVGQYFYAGGVLNETKTGTNSTFAGNVNIITSNSSTGSSVSPKMLIYNEGAGDSALQLAVSGSLSYYLGVDNSDDTFKIGNASWDSSPFMAINSIGRVSIGGDLQSANTLTLTGSATEFDINNTSGKRYRFNCDTSGNLKFEDKTAGTEVMRFASNNNVGIGATGPGYKLHVAGTFHASGQSVLSAGNSSYTADGLYNANALPSVVNTPGGQNILFGYFDNGAGGYFPRIGFKQTHNSSNSPNTTSAKTSLGLESDGRISFKVGASNAVEALSIKPDGKIGVGTTSPQTQLDVNGGVRAQTVEYSWHRSNPITSANSYRHLKTTLHAGSGSNTMYIMGGFTLKSYAYNSNGYGEGSCMFHNWNGSFYSLSVTNRGQWPNFVRSPYVSSDGYVVIVCEHNTYSQPIIDFYQFYTPYGWRSVTVSADTTSNNLTGVY
jgi:hypothetical protein